MTNYDVKFYANGREFKTLCKSVKNADSFRVKFTVAGHSITAEISDKCYFKTIDGIDLNGIKTDYYICKDYLTMKGFIYNLKYTFDIFINTALHDEKIIGTVDELLWTVTQFPHVVSTFNNEDLFETVETEATETESEVTEPETATETSTAEKMIQDYENFIEEYESHKQSAEPETVTDPEREERAKLSKEKIPNLNNFHNAIIKALGMTRAKEVRYTIQGVNVFFEFHGEMYKCYTPQSKLYKLSGQRFNLITWRDMKKEASETDDNSGVIYTARSPPESFLLNMSRKNIN